MLQAIFGLFSRQRQIMPVQEPIETNDSLWTWISGRLQWCPTSLEALKTAEENILSFVRSPFKLSYVDVMHRGKECQIRTLTMNVDGEETEGTQKRTPLVMLHGLGSGVGLWVLNLDALAQNQPLYAIDILGFGLSSRPSFRGGAEEVENQLLDSIENWRQKMELEKFILLGHSMGGYLATAYAIRHPDRISHLILADPWGFPDRDETASLRIHIPLWAKVIGSVMKYFNPMTSLRIAGPWGPKIIKKVRPDIIQKFTILVDNPDVISDYIYHCNAQSPSGESAFKTMSADFGWAKKPMLPRISNLKEDVPMTFIYGSRSWIDSKSGHAIQKLRGESMVDVFLVPRAGHHVYADQPELFHAIIRDICNKVEKNMQDEDYHIEDYEFLNYVS